MSNQPNPRARFRELFYSPSPQPRPVAPLPPLPLTAGNITRCRTVQELDAMVDLYLDSIGQPVGSSSDSLRAQGLINESRLLAFAEARRGEIRCRR